VDVLLHDLAHAQVTDGLTRGLDRGRLAPRPTRCRSRVDLRPAGWAAAVDARSDITELLRDRDWTALVDLVAKHRNVITACTGSHSRAAGACVPTVAGAARNHHSAGVTVTILVS
jgi:hypothetical protein